MCVCVLKLTGFCPNFWKSGLGPCMSFISISCFPALIQLLLTIPVTLSYKSGAGLSVLKSVPFCVLRVFLHTVSFFHPKKCLFSPFLTKILPIIPV